MSEQCSWCGAPVNSPAYVASISTGWYSTSGWREAASSISSFSIPSYTGETVHFGPPYTRAPIRSAVWNAYSATARQVERVSFSVR